MDAPGRRTGVPINNGTESLFFDKRKLPNDDSRLVIG